MGKHSLLAQVLKETPVSTGRREWCELLQESDPERMEQIDELINAFLDGKCKGWTKSQIVKRIITFGSPVKETAIERYIEHRREARNAKATD